MNESANYRSLIIAFQLLLKIFKLARRRDDTQLLLLFYQYYVNVLFYAPILIELLLLLLFPVVFVSLNVGDSALNSSAFLLPNNPNTRLAQNSDYYGIISCVYPKCIVEFTKLKLLKSNTESLLLSLSLSDYRIVFPRSLSVIVGTVV